MNPFDTILTGFLHHPKLSGALVVLAVAFISSMPEEIPKSAQEWWTWLRNGLQSSTPIHRMPPQQK